MTDKIYRVSIINRLRMEKIDLALNSVYTRELALDCLATACGAVRSVAFRALRRRGAYDFPIRYNWRYTQLVDSVGLYKTEIARHRDFLMGIGIDVQVLFPCVWLTEQDEAYAHKFFIDNKLEQQNTIACFAGALSARRHYDYYGHAIGAVCGDAATLIVLGGNSDHLVNERSFRGYRGRIINLCGQTTLRQAAALIKRCRLAIGAETGLAHVACAVNTPNVIVLGGGHFGRFMPYAASTTVVALPLDCYGCDWKCRYKATHCIQEMNPRLLAYAIRERLDSNFAKPRVVLQDKSLYEEYLIEPQWSPVHHLLEYNRMDVIVVTRNMLDVVSDVVVS
jgi:ADP-heptose:LPS heptosyltransferase